MSTVNYAYREILCKVVYYGPGVGGKTTNLQIVHGQVDQSARGDLVSLATETERTLYFDFLPLDLGEIKGFKVRFQLYTVPGQVQYNATRKLVLQGVDGIVFVADSQSDRMEENLQSLQNLRDNLKDYGMVLEEIPFVLQLNKRDLKHISSVEEMTKALSINDCPVFEAVAVSGQGVKQTLKKILGMVLSRLHDQTSGQKGVAPLVPTAGDDLDTEVDTEPITEADSTALASPNIAPKPAVKPAPIAPLPPRPVGAPPIAPAKPAAAASVGQTPPAAGRPSLVRQRPGATPHPPPSRPEGSPLQVWLKELPSGLVRQRCDVYWNLTRIGSGTLEMQRDGSEEFTTTPKFHLAMERRVLGLFSGKEQTNIFASINSQRTTGFGQFYVLVDKDLLGITGDVKHMRGWRVFLQKGETPFIYATRKTIGGQFLLVPEGKREISPE